MYNYVTTHKEFTERKLLQLITAEEARKLGAGKAEFQYNDGKWGVCNKWCIYNDTENFKYRAKPSPARVSGFPIVAIRGERGSYNLKDYGLLERGL